MENVQELLNVDIHNIAWQGHSFLRTMGFRPQDYDFAFVSLAALAYCTRKNDFSKAEELQGFVDKQFTDFSLKGKLLNFVSEYWSQILEYSNMANMKELLATALFSPEANIHLSTPEMSTPISVAKLVGHILQINDEDIVLDLCSGKGNFLSVIATQYHMKKAIGIEIQTEGVLTAILRAKLLQDRFSIQQGDVLKVDYQYLNANKVFSDYPLATYLPDELEKDKRYAPYWKYFSRRSADWAFLIAAVSNQKDGGRTVVTAHDAMLSRDMRRERDLREVLSKSGRVEAIITLPERMYRGTTLSISLIVLSQHNTSIKMVDARKLGTSINRKLVELSNQDIDTIMNALGKNSEISRDVSLDELAKNYYNWLPSRYLMMDKVQVNNGASLKDLAISFHRGNPKIHRDLKDLKSDEPTECQYLLAQDIQDNRVVDSLQYIKPIDETLYRTEALKTGDLLVTRIAPFKVAVVPDVKQQKIFVNGNIYFITLDKEKVNPIYAMLYLNSAQGKLALNALSPGGVLSSLSLKDLESIQIPMIPMAEQEKIATKYQALITELDALKKQEDDIQDEISQLLEGED